MLWSASKGSTSLHLSASISWFAPPLMFVFFAFSGRRPPLRRTQWANGPTEKCDCVALNPEKRPAPTRCAASDLDMPSRTARTIPVCRESFRVAFRAVHDDAQVPSRPEVLTSAVCGTLTNTLSPTYSSLTLRRTSNPVRTTLVATGIRCPVRGLGPPTSADRYIAGTAPPPYKPRAPPPKSSPTSWSPCFHRTRLRPGCAETATASL